MPQLSNLVVNDRQATPVAHTFVPRDIVNGVATLVESTGVPIADRRATLSLTRTANGRMKPILKLTIPVVQDSTLNGITKPTVVRTAYAEVNFSFDEASTTAERRDTIAYVANALAASQTMVMNVLQDLQGIY